MYVPVRRGPAVALALVVASFALVSCSGDDGTRKDPEQLAARLETARSQLDDAASLSFSLRTPELPSGVTGLVKADGKGTHAPAFDGKVTVSRGGSTVTADVIAVDGKVYAKLGFSPRFVPLDPASVGAPDPAALMSADDGVSSLLTAAEDLEQGERSRDGSDVLTTVRGVLPGKVVQRLIPSADGSAEFDATFRLDDDDALRDATIEGPFYPDGDAVRYTVEVTASDENVDITAP